MFKLKSQLIYETSDLVAVNKPSGLISQPSVDKTRTNLYSLLLLEYKEIYPLHRLDKDTSGIILFAKNKFAATRYGEIFKTHLFEKKYLCLSFGVKKNSEGSVENHLKEQELNREGKKVRLFLPAQTGGDYAKTDYKILFSENGYSLVEAQPITGRTHQIRTHLATTKLPIVGDRFYGPKENSENLKYDQFYLHAHSLRIPSEQLNIKCLPDSQFQHLTKTLLPNLPPNWFQL